MVITTQYQGGTAMVRGKEEQFDKHFVFDAGKQGTATIHVRTLPCSEEQRKRNKAMLDEAVRRMVESSLEGKT